MPVELVPALPAGTVCKVNANVNTIQVFSNPNNAQVALQIPVPGSNRLEQRPFSIRAGGYLTAGTAGNAQLVLMSGTSLVSGNNTILAQSAATALTQATFPFRLDAEFIFDSVSGKLFGNFKSQIGGTLGASATLTSGLTGLSGISEPVFTLVFGVAFATANAGNLANLGYFSLIN